LVELETRGGGAALLPLLVDENERRLAAWRPEVVLPESFPSVALGAALVGTCALLLAFVLAPRLAPDPVARSRAERVARLMPLRGIAPESARVALAEEDADEMPALERLPARMQDRIRRRFWGDGWQAAPETTAAASHGAEPGA